MNLQKNDSAKMSHFYRFIKTHKGTFNENTRTENVSVKINLNTLKGEYMGKESLSGQFSTVLRHYYLNEIIDSTISPHYFRRCTGKPGFSAAQHKLSTHIDDFPFRYTFNCKADLKMARADQLSLENWFAFPLSRASLPEAPNHKFYFDFDFSDAYHFLLQFDSPVDIVNKEQFKHEISNDLFELHTEIVQQDPQNYLVKAQLQVKKMSVEVKDAGLLMDLVNQLEEVNHFVLVLK
jgi:hypothetical protein